MAKKVSNPLVSIIIPAYNRADLIGETLDSVLAQTYPTWECIVVDDGSTDSTKEVVQTYVERDFRFILVDRPDTHKPGGNGARNYGFEISQGVYIQWFDSDDILINKSLFEKVQILKKYPNTDLVLCYQKKFRNRVDNIIGELTYDEKDNFLENHIISYKNINVQGSFWRRTFIESKEMFNEDLVINQEWEFFSRTLCYNNPQITIVKDFLNLIRKHNKSITTNYRTSKSLYSSFNARLKVFKLLKASNQLTERMAKHFAYLFTNLIKATHSIGEYELCSQMFDELEEQISMNNDINLIQIMNIKLNYKLGLSLKKGRKYWFKYWLTPLGKSIN